MLEIRAVPGRLERIGDACKVCACKTALSGEKLRNQKPTTATPRLLGQSKSIGTHALGITSHVRLQKEAASFRILLFSLARIFSCPSRYFSRCHFLAIRLRIQISSEPNFFLCLCHLFPALPTMCLGEDDHLEFLGGPQDLKLERAPTRMLPSNLETPSTEKQYANLTGLKAQFREGSPV